MKSSFDLKHNLGRITPETQDDLWIMSEIIRPGDLVKAKTQRSIEVQRGEGKEKVGKKTIILTILVEKITLDQSLRIGGKIVDGPEDIGRGYHTLNISENEYFEVAKHWKSWEVQKIKAAAIKAEPVTVLILDDEEADFYLITEKTEHRLHLKGGGSGKSLGGTKKPEYFGKIIAEIEKTDTQKIVVAGPGFTKENLLSAIKEKNKELLKKINADSVSHTGEVGLQELLKRGALEKILKSSRISEETETVEKLLAEIVKDGPAVYGINETEKAVKAGAVSVLLVSDKKVRELEDLMEEAEKNRSKVMIISSLHQSGEKLFRLGGIAAILRYKM